MFDSGYRGTRCLCAAVAYSFLLSFYGVRTSVLLALLALFSSCIPISYEFYLVLVPLHSIEAIIHRLLKYQNYYYTINNRGVGTQAPGANVSSAGQWHIADSL